MDRERGRPERGRKVPWKREAGNKPFPQGEGPSVICEVPGAPAGASVRRVKGGRRELVEGEDRSFDSSEPFNELVVVTLKDLKRR